MKFIRNLIPDWKSVLLALLSAVLIIFSFPDFEYWVLAWFGLVPLLWAVERESRQIVASFTLGWIFGTVYFFGTCWWLTYAPITYGGFPWPLAYFLILIACIGAGVFPAIFAALAAALIRRVGGRAFYALPFVWVFAEFVRYWLTGNNWNAIGYSQAFGSELRHLASIGGVALVSFVVVGFNCVVYMLAVKRTVATGLGVGVAALVLIAASYLKHPDQPSPHDGIKRESGSAVIGLQPNVPMSGMDMVKSDRFRNRHLEMAEAELSKLDAVSPDKTRLIVMPESPMNFMYTDDPEFQRFIGDFARRKNASVLFNSAEPDTSNGKYFNSAVMVGANGKKVDSYDKIYLVPFGEAVPPPLDGIVPGFVGNFSYGREYDLFPVGDARAGVMICFESHFGQLSRQYVRNGADLLIEMTNDGYLGPTPVLHQHLANAVFRAVETNRPVMRVTNVGVMAYIAENGSPIDAAPTYQEATRTWFASKSDGSQTFYVRYGDWFAWLSSVVTVILFLFSIRRERGTISG